MSDELEVSDFQKPDPAATSIKWANATVCMAAAIAAYREALSPRERDEFTDTEESQAAYGLLHDCRWNTEFWRSIAAGHEPRQARADADAATDPWATR